MDLDVVWTQGKCNGDAYFVSNNEVCFRTGSFIKICSTDEFSEYSIQGPLSNIECICADVDLSLIAVKNQNIYVLNYPGFEIVADWKLDTFSCTIQMCFSGDEYLLTLEGSPNFELIFWDWKKSVKLQSFHHKFPIEVVSRCFMSIHPGFKKILVFQQIDNLHFYEIDDVLSEVNIDKKTMYLPVTGDEVGESFLDKKRIENLTYFDKMLHDSWGIHSELLHSFPLKNFCSDLSEHEVVEFYDFLSKQERLEVTCHCWLPDKRLLVACSNGTILSTTLSFSIKIIQFSSKKASDFDNYITRMALSRTGLYVAEKNGDIFIVKDIDRWSQTNVISIEESPVSMKFSPDFQTLLFVNCNSSVLLLNVKETDDIDASYLSICQDDSQIVGIFTVSPDYCITAKHSGLIEILDLKSGVLIADYVVEDNIKCMECCPSCSVLLISGYSSYVYSIDFSDTQNLKCIQIIRPCENAIEIMSCEPYGRFAILVPSDRYIFLYSILPSRGFIILGYISVEYCIKDLAAFSRSDQDTTFLTLLGKEESNDFIVNMEIPGDFVSNYTKYWKDSSGIISSQSFKLVDIDMKVNCFSLVAHHLEGVILHFPSLDRFISVPFHNLKTFDFKLEEESYENYDKCRLFLSSSQTWLLSISESGDIAVRNPDNFTIVSTHKLSYYSRFLSRSGCAFYEDLVIVEGCKGVAVCLKFPYLTDRAKMPWERFCENKRKEENIILSEMKTVTKTKLRSFIEEKLEVFYQLKIKELKEKKDALEDKFNRIKKTLNDLVEENFSVPLEHQLQSEEFVFAENIREEMVQSRSEELENHENALKEKIAELEKNIGDIKKECLDDMHTKGKILKSFKKGSPLYNYSIPAMSEKEKGEICHAHKTNLLDKCLEKVKLGEDVKLEDFEKELSFDTIPKYENKEDIGKEFQKQPFQLQNREERMDYIFTLKYIIFLKRRAFNNRFDEIDNLQRSTIEKIQENISRIKEILLLIREERPVWEPSNIYNGSVFEVKEEEIVEARRVFSEKYSDEIKGLAEEFLKDEWLLKLKATSLQKYHVRLKKDSIDLLKKELDKRYKSNDVLVNNYEKAHAQLVQEKLQWDLEISKDELQIFLILFSMTNFSSFKKWEIHNRKTIADLECECNFYENRMNSLEVSISNFKHVIEKLEKESSSLDYEVSQISKMSRNKQSFLDAYKMRPQVTEETDIDLNPYKIKEVKKRVSKEILEQLNDSKNKPARVPFPLWKQLCSLREKKISIEGEIDEKNRQIDKLKYHSMELNDILKSLKMSIRERKGHLQDLHEKRIRCNFETPMMLTISHPQLEIQYPDNLDFRRALFLRRYHMEGLNCMISNVGTCKLQEIEEMERNKYQIEKYEAKVRIDKLKTKEAMDEIELSKRIPLTKDIQKIIQDPKGFNLTDKIYAFEKSKQMEMSEIEKQMAQTEKRISNIEVQKDILKRSMKDKKKEIEKLKGDIAELRKIESLKSNVPK